MLKDFLAFYGVMRLLEDAGEPSPPDDAGDGGDDKGMCGCFIFIAFFALISGIAILCR